MCTKVCFAMGIVAFGKQVLKLVSQSVQMDWLCQNWAGIWSILVC